MAEKIQRKPIFGGNFKAGQEEDTKKGKESIDISFKYLNSYFQGMLSYPGKGINQFPKAIAELENTEVFIAPPYPYLHCVKVIIGENLALGAQDIDYEDRGARTSAVTGPMLKDVDVNYVIVGHSERRHTFGDTNEIVAKKAVAVYRNGMVPIICVGETLDERESEKLYEIVEEQVCSVFNKLRLEGYPTVDSIIAYEPVWAIGTGKNATPQQAQEMHQYIKEILASKFNKNVAGSARIMYGGSVTPNNITDLMAQPDIDGALVGGASLDPKSFLEIVKKGTEAFYRKQ